MRFSPLGNLGGLALFLFVPAFSALAGCAPADDGADSADSNLDQSPAAAVASGLKLPTFPALTLSISTETNPNRDFVAIESDGVLDFTADAGLTEPMVIGLQTSGGTPVHVTVTLTRGEKQADVITELQRQVSKVGFTSEVSFKDGTFAKVSIFKPGAAARPAPSRNEGNLSVVFKAVALGEQNSGVGALNDGPATVSDDGTAGPPHSDAFAALSPDLKNFITLGTDSLTTHEAMTLGRGLGIIHESGRSGQTFRSGDRVEFTATDATGASQSLHGIVMSANDGGTKPDSLEILTVVNGKYTNADASMKLVVTRLVAGALLDHK